MGLLKDFKEFALKGNVLDLAVAVIVAGAFSPIVKSAIDDLIMPIVSIPGKVDFSNLYLPLTDKVSKALADSPTGTLALDEARKLGPVFAYGNFITLIINFTILAFCVFLIVRVFNAAKKQFEAKEAAAAAAAPPPPPTRDQELLAEIRDLLRQGRA